MKETANRSVKVVIDITCDTCGASVIPDIQKTDQDNLDNFDAFGVLHAEFGYGSKQDGDSFHFDLCEKCFGELVDTVNKLRVSNGFRK
ncbi:hypothetical protein [Idiomarina piscisalsi]|uniref:hypothetical protein n=1 Tax=Idiomarina piscisalsi TaxID=1096243 RepID=UPI001382992A|nr:hypothetical protein [Idiomarina piscisalsi]MTJ02675.1 hypothetical protein [Idiomarina piscisalsi]